MNGLEQARADLRKQLDWRGPNGKPQAILTLTRNQAETLLTGPTDPVAVMDEIVRLALLLPKDVIESYGPRLLCDISSSDCNGGLNGICGCARSNAAVTLVLTPKP